MSWLKVGDNAWSNPITQRVRAFLRGCKERVSERDVVALELFGFAVACASLAASHKTDYVIGYGTACSVAHGRTDRLLELAVRSGYMEELPEQRDGEPLYKIVSQSDFIHMFLKAEEEWMRQRKADTANPALCVPIRLRDGDACRYCGVIVVRGGDKRSDRYGTYDHRVPGQPGTVDTMVIACNGCNRLRGDKPDADDRIPIQPPPQPAYYSKETLNYLSNNLRFVPPHLQVQLNLTPAAVSAGRAITETSDPASSRAPRPATPPPAGQRTSAGRQPSAPVDGTRSADPADPRYPGSGFAGSGRDGPGARSDLAGTAGSANGRRRGSRGRGRRPR